MTPRVLIMGTDAFSRGSLGSWLKRHGCQVCEADHQIEARRLLQKEDLDVVLLSLNDYRTESLSIMRGLKKQSKNAPFILLTSPQNIRLSIEGMKMGAFDALAVPVDVDLLLERIVAACSGRRKTCDPGLETLEKTNRRSLRSLVRFMDAVGLKKARGWFGSARLP